MKIANLFLAVLFALSVAVQFNDPDPLAWAAIYGSASILCVLASMGKRVAPAAAAVAVLATAWATMVATRVIGEVPLSEVFTSMRMGSRGIEEAREMGGLLIIAIWMTVIFIVDRRR